VKRFDLGPDCDFRGICQRALPNGSGFSGVRRPAEQPMNIPGATRFYHDSYRRSVSKAAG
jgi:hypothetical protein